MDSLELKYTEEHEWIVIDAAGVGLVGISQHAADSLGDVVFVDLPQVGDNLEQFGKLGEIESVKAFSELFSPVSGSVVEVNDSLSDAPDLINENPYESGWMVKILLSDLSELDKLMSASEYETFVSESETH
ncbi:MAG: glycine cleavage system protein GcvH [Chloroflexota bacterium]|uniref:Lipoyl-binding domain-containing protein n=1 Tax=marine metagenome TaxID=408172 RepID=A0A382B4R4_9ZZZZ|nr:glycine cleavage system protein GcvH [Chloroflexota bacterium]MEC9321668.1 glycine cleavage system protein GcvH [Chloroflexota bacterium]|tara:strand:+ start:160 stop:552 length:393 start_codon:yes stop_codon:yes gene_type:complete